MHGGVIATILDEIMSWNAKGSVLEIVNEREATIEGFLFDDRQRLCARSSGTYALFGADTARKLKVVDEAAIKSFMPIFRA